MIRAIILLVLAACAYSAEQQKHVEVETEKTGATRTEEAPSTVAEFDPPAFPDQPLKDRLRKLEQKGGTKTWSEDWQKNSFGEDEHLDVAANVGPKGLFSWLGFAAAAVGLLGVAGALAWKLKPPWLGWLFKLFGRSPAPDSTAGR